MTFAHGLGLFFIGTILTVVGFTIAYLLYERHRKNIEQIEADKNFILKNPDYLYPVVLLNFVLSTFCFEFQFEFYLGRLARDAAAIQQDCEPQNQ